MSGGSLWGRGAGGYGAPGFDIEGNIAKQVRSPLGVKYARMMVPSVRTQAWPPSSHIPFYAVDNCNAQTSVSVHNPGTGLGLWGAVLYWCVPLDYLLLTDTQWATTNHILSDSAVGGLEDSITPEVDSGDSTNVPVQSWNLRRGIWNINWQLGIRPELLPTDGDGHTWSWSMDVAPSRQANKFERGYKTTRVDRDHPSVSDGMCHSSGTFTVPFRITNEWIINFRLGVQANNMGGLVEGDFAYYAKIFAYRTAFPMA